MEAPESMRRTATERTHTCTCRPAGAVSPVSQSDGGGGAAVTDPLGNPGTSTGGPVGAGADPAAVPEAVEEDEEEEEEDEEEDEEEEAGGGALKFPAAAAGAAGGRAPAGGLGTAGTGMDDARGGA